MSGASGSTAPESHFKQAKICAGCEMEDGGGKKFKWCQSCHSASYCGRECQKADWPRHKHNCKANQLTLKLSQEAHGDEGALGASRQNQWVIRMEPLFNFLIATLLDKKRDTHVMLLTTERLAKRPYFKVQHYKVITVDAIAVELPHKFAPTLLDAMQMLKMRNQEGNHAYGLVVIKCSNDGMVPAVIMPLDSADSEIPHYPADHILRLINEEPIT